MAKPKPPRRPPQQQGQELVRAAAPLPPRPTEAPATPPPASGAQQGEAMPLSHATAFALRDVAAHHNMTATAAAEYAIGLWHWITAQEKQGHVLCMADADGEVYRVELPPVKAASV